MSSPSRIREKGFGRRFRAEGCWANKPNEVNPSCNNKIQGFWPKRTQVGYLPWNLSVTAKFGPFFDKYECERSIKDSVPKSPSMLPLIPRRTDWRRLPGRRCAVRGGTCQANARAGCPCHDQGTSRLHLNLEGRSGTRSTTLTHHVVESSALKK